MTALIDPALYVYGIVMNGAPLPRCADAILAGAALLYVTQAEADDQRAPAPPTLAQASQSGLPAHPLQALPAMPLHPPLAALVSPVPRALFAPDGPGKSAGDPVSRAADPDWIAARAAAHHEVVASLAACTACLPLGFGTLFSNADAVRRWLGANHAGLHAALADVGACTEWSLSMTEDEAAHADWVAVHDPDLRALSDKARGASPGTAFLIERRYARAEAEARAAHLACATARIAERLSASPVRTRPEGQGAWSLLAGSGLNLAMLLEPLADEVEGTGLALRIAGPFPPYAFARAAFDASAHG